MNTENLIHALVIDGSRPVIPIGRTLLRALGLAIILAELSLFIRHPRLDIVQAFSTTPFVFKLILMLALTGTSTVALVDAARPISAPHRRWVLILAPLLLGGGVIVELITVPSQAWTGQLIGHNAVHCLTSIPLLSLAPLACLLLALRGGAPAQPVLAGGAAGLLAAGVGATIYALTCPDDSPLFIAAWYSVAIALVTATSAFIGRRLLRW
jgi:hypothetical protein